MFETTNILDHSKCFYFFSAIRIVIDKFQEFILSSTKQKFGPFDNLSRLFYELINKTMLVIKLVTSLRFLNIND